MNLNPLAMSLNDDDFISLFGAFIGPILPLMLMGETMWIDARTVATLEERTGDRFTVHARKRNGMALVSRIPFVIRRKGFTGKESVYNYSSPKHLSALREIPYCNAKSLGMEDEYMIADEYQSNIDPHVMLFGEPNIMRGPSGRD